MCPGVIWYEKISIRISCIDIDLEKLDLTIDQYGKNIIDGLDILINFLQNKIDNWYKNLIKINVFYIFYIFYNGIRFYQKRKLIYKIAVYLLQIYIYK